MTTGTILITLVDRVILPRVLPALQEEFGLSNTAAGFVNSLNFIGITIGAIAPGVFDDVLGSETGRASVETRWTTWSKRASRSWAATL